MCKGIQVDNVGGWCRWRGAGLESECAGVRAGHGDPKRLTWDGCTRREDCRAGGANSHDDPQASHNLLLPGRGQVDAVRSDVAGRVQPPELRHLVPGSELPHAVDGGTAGLLGVGAGVVAAG